LGSNRRFSIHVDLLGGREKFSAKLDEFCNTPYSAKGICRDFTGVIGQ
jgi:hypothetical protein